MKLVSITCKRLPQSNWSEKRTCWDISSVNESRIVSIFNKNEMDIVNFHKKFLTRIYPAGSRVNSSNYDPIIPFLAGSQIIALNFQTPDLPMLIYLSKFQENGGNKCGYLLKPSWMQSSCTTQMAPSNFVNPIKVMKLRIISGHQLK